MQDGVFKGHPPSLARPEVTSFFLVKRGKRTAYSVSLAQCLKRTLEYESFPTMRSLTFAIPREFLL